MAHEAEDRPDVDSVLKGTDAYDDGANIRIPEKRIDARKVAVSDADVRGIDQTEKHVKILPQTADLGWNNDADDMPRSLMEGMSNDDYWVLVRRFDNVGSACVSC